MKGLLVLAMKGRMQAVMAAVVTAVLALVVSPLSILSDGLVVLATLRNGPREGLLVVLLGTLAMAALGLLLFGAPAALGLMGLMLWLPAWGLALVQGRTRSLARTIEAATLGGMLLVLFQYFWLGDPASFWSGLLQEYMQQHWDPQVIPEAQQRELLAGIAAWMPGGLAGAWTLSMAVAVLFAGWAQGRLEPERRFGEPFRWLRLSRPWLILVPVLLLVALATPGPSLPGQLFVVATVPFLLQGLAMAHGLVAGSGASRGWLAGLYFVLIVGMPYSVTAVAAAGYADGWLDFRARVRGDGPSGPDER